MGILSLRLLGVSLVGVGLLTGGWGLYQDTTAPPCQDALGSPAGGCQEPGLVELFTGVALTAIGLTVVGGTQIVRWRRNRPTRSTE